TGLSYDVGTETVGKSLQLLKEAVPKLQVVAVLFNPGNPGNVRALENVRVAASALGLQLLVLEARRPDELDHAFAAMASERMAALLLIPDSMFFAHMARLVELTLSARLPSVHGF